MPYADPEIAKKKRREWYHRDKQYFLDAEKKFLANPINLEKRRLRIRARMKLPKNREKIARWKREQNDKYLRLWQRYIPKIVKCEICAILVSFLKRPDMGLIHFDHRLGGTENIQITPRKWLKQNKPTLENLKIWESCDFGFLCLICNSKLPTKNRIEFLKKALAYAEI